MASIVHSKFPLCGVPELRRFGISNFVCSRSDRQFNQPCVGLEDTSEQLEEGRYSGYLAVVPVAPSESSYIGNAAIY